MDQAFKRTQYIDNFFNGIKSLNNFDQADLRNLVGGMLSSTIREVYFTLNYHRAAINVELLLTLTDTKQFQALAMLARSIFESAVEIKLISIIPDAIRKIHLFTDVEKLRTAKKIRTFKTAHPDPALPRDGYEDFILKNETRILADQAKVWPGVKKVSHWSLKTMAERAQALGAPFHEIYEVNYAELSWYVHSGVVGVAHLNPQIFADLAGVAFIIAYHSYTQILEAVIDEFNFQKVDPAIKTKMTYAKFVPFMQSEEEAAELLRACTTA